MKTKVLIFLFSSLLITGCTPTSLSEHSSIVEENKKLNVPNFEELTKIDTLYIDESNKTYSSQYSVGEDAFEPTYYDLLNSAIYVGKMEDNDLLNNSNITLTIWKSDTDKINYVIYKKDNTCYLEDIANKDLYTISTDVFNDISNDFN